MKIATSVLLVATVLCWSASAQTAKTKRSAWPSDLAAAAGQDSDSLLRNPLIKARIRKLLGKDYDSFMDSFETLNPVMKEGNHLFSSGCLIHACTHVESAIAIDLINQTVHAAIFRQTEKTRYFNEAGKATPAVIKGWANNLRQINNQSSSLADAQLAGTQVETSAPKKLRSMVPVHGFIGGESHDAYVVHARKGQALTLRLSWRRADDNQAAFSVSESTDFSGEPAKFGSDSNNDTRWTGTIPRTGNYYVYVTAHPSARYTLRMSLK